MVIDEEVAVASVSWLRARRLNAQFLTGHTQSPLDVVRRLAAVQAQNVPAARWAVGVRSSRARLGDVEDLFASGAVLRSWTMRGTLHLVAAEDLGWMLSLTSARQRAAVDREARQRGISPHDFDRASAVIVDQVAEHGPTTRAEALSALERAGVDTSSERGYRYIRDAALRGLVAWGPYRGAQPELVLVPHAPPLQREEALGRYLTRYAAGHGPITVRDFAWWSGLTLSDARRAREVAAGALTTVRVGDDEFLVAPSELDATPARPRGLKAIAAWDEYVLGYGDRSAALPAEHAWRVSPTGNGVFLPAIVSAGRVVGTWRHSIRRSVATVEAKPFSTLTESERHGLETEAARLTRFLGVEPGGVVIP